MLLTVLLHRSDSTGKAKKEDKTEYKKKDCFLFAFFIYVDTFHLTDI